MSKLPKVVNIRKEKCSFKGCRKPDNTIPSPPEEGFLGNPFFLRNVNDYIEREKVIGQYREYFYDRIAKEPEFKRAVLALRDVDSIGCFCAPKPCHLDIVVEYMREYLKQQRQNLKDVFVSPEAMEMMQNWDSDLEGK